MLELVKEKEKEEEPDKIKKDFDDFLEVLILMSELERIMKRLNEIMKSNEED